MVCARKERCQDEVGGWRLQVSRKTHVASHLSFLAYSRHPSPNRIDDMPVWRAPPHPSFTDHGLARDNPLLIEEVAHLLREPRNTLRQLRTSRVRLVEHAHQLLLQHLQVPICAKSAHTHMCTDAHASDQACSGCLWGDQLEHAGPYKVVNCYGIGGLIARAMAQLRSLSGVLKRTRRSQLALLRKEHERKFDEGRRAWRS